MQAKLLGADASRPAILARVGPLPVPVRQAVLVAEDREFYNHSGPRAPLQVAGEPVRPAVTASSDSSSDRPAE
jgi:hypothetical protein